MSKNNYKKLFAHIYEYEPRESINQTAFARIERYNAIRGRIYYALHSVIVVLSGISLIAVARFIYNSARDAGLFEYISIFLSDHAAAMTNWKELTLSITDSLPFTEMAILLTIALIFINSAIRINYNRKNIINFNKQTI